MDKEQDPYFLRSLNNLETIIFSKIKYKYNVLSDNGQRLRTMTQPSFSWNNDPL